MGGLVSVVGRTKKSFDPTGCETRLSISGATLHRPSTRKNTRGHGSHPRGPSIVASIATGYVLPVAPAEALLRGCSGQARQRQGNYAQRQHARRHTLHGGAQYTERRRGGQGRARERPRPLSAPSTSASTAAMCSSIARRAASASRARTAA